MDTAASLTDRQRREVDYHREHAREHEALLRQPFSWDVVLDRLPMMAAKPLGRFVAGRVLLAGHVAG